MEKNGGALVVVVLVCLLGFAMRPSYGQTSRAEIEFPIQELYDADCRALTMPGRVPPSDYRKATQAQREIVERFHFTEHYAAYLAGKAKFQKQIDRIYESPAAGFDYTLWAFPNHPTALAAMEDLGTKHKSEHPQGSLLRVHCYFQRAVRVAPDDALVRALYAYYYARRGKAEQSREQIALADGENGRDSRNVQSYLAWSYIQIPDLDQATVHAKRAYELGLTLPGLKQRLAKLGRPLD